MNSPNTTEAPETGHEESGLEEMIAQSVQRLFSDQISATLLDAAEAGEWPAGLWAKMEDNGFPLALCAPESGGSGARWIDVYPILAGIGYWSLPLPLAETMLASWLLEQAGAEVPAGPITLAPAEVSLVLTAASAQAPSTLNGVLHGVAWARNSAWLLTSIEDDGGTNVILIDLSLPSVEIETSCNMAGEPRDNIRLHDVPAAACLRNPLPDLPDPLLALGALTRSAMLVGALERALDLTIQYANERVQFGKPIARNQVIQHELAVVAAEVVGCKVATRVAFSSLDPARATSTSAFDIAVAKTRCGQTTSRMATVAHQVHGAIGFTDEYALQRTTRRLWAWRQEFGSDATWAAELGRAAIAQGGAQFWERLCERRSDPILSTNTGSNRA
ncbi:MAG: acyl-CoA dehydrogenase family protein [Pseudomonadota bacterium]